MLGDGREAVRHQEVLGTAADSNEQCESRRSLEEALEQRQTSEAEFRTITDAIPTQVWCALPDGSAEFQNRTWLEYTGMRPDDTGGEKWRPVIHPDDLQSYVAWWERTWQTQAHGEAEARFRRHDGVYRWFLSRAIAVRDEEGRVVKWYGTNTDIEDLKRAEEALRRSEQVARGQVEALVQSLDALATNPAPDQFIVRMLSTIGQSLDASWLALWLLDESSNTLGLRAAVRDGESIAPDMAHPFIEDPHCWNSDPGVQELFATGAPMICEDVESDARVPANTRAYFKAQGTKNFLRLPVLLGGEVKGFITVFHGERPSYEPAEVDLAQALAHQAMLAMQIGQAATLEERNRMARDIHDTLAQGFTAVIIQLQAAEDARERGLGAELTKHLRAARELARESLNEARRSVRALRPQALERAPFWEALKRIVKSTTAGTLRTNFRLHGQAHELPPLWQEHLLHICQEALTNTLKYACATRFDCGLTFAPDELRLELRDDGVGFDLNAKHEGSGLLGMRERAAKISANLEIVSASGAGTRITVVLPSATNGCV